MNSADVVCKALAAISEEQMMPELRLAGPSVYVRDHLVRADADALFSSLGIRGNPMRYLSIIVLAMTIYLAANQFWLRGRSFSPLGEAPVATRDSPLVRDLMREAAPDDVAGYRRIMATFETLRMNDEANRINWLWIRQADGHVQTIMAGQVTSC